MTQLTLDTYNRIPRVGSLILSPDGRRLVFTLQQLGDDASRFVTSLWEIDTGGAAPPRRLTRSADGESSPAFLPDGSLLFASRRPAADAGGAGTGELESGLLMLPAGAGEARPLLTVKSTVDAVAAARAAAVAVIRVPLLPETAAPAADAEKAKRREEAGTSAVLFDQHPIRYWDHDLGPREPHLLRLPLTPGADGVDPHDLVPNPGLGFQEAACAVSPDGATAVTTWWEPVAGGDFRVDLVAIGEGGRRVLLSETRCDHEAPAVSPDGRWVAALRTRRGTPEDAERVSMVLVPLGGGSVRELMPDLDRWPGPPAWTPDSRAIVFSADDGGQKPVFRHDLESGETRRVTAEGCYSSLCVAPDGDRVYAIRSSYSHPPEIVAVNLPDGNVSGLPTPGRPLELPGRMEEVSAPAEDGTVIHGRLVLPTGATAGQPAPLVLWVHGGPLTSWNEWHWRWNPHLMAERGYAVLLPDPALSTGYGQAFIQRAWGTWGERVMADVMALTDAVLRRPELDASRTAMMGGSFGGYMANWIAGHTERFRAIVTHAGLWDLRQFHGTTDMPTRWEDHFGEPYGPAEGYDSASPHRHVGAIRTPMLVIHGANDYRVPIGEGLRLYTDLRRHGVSAQFLLFPDENHWVLRPGNARAWYQTVLAFLDHHVLGRPWTRPELL